MFIECEFSKLGEFDVSSLREKVGALPESAWEEDAGRQKIYDVHASTQTIPLVYDYDGRHKNPTRRPLMAAFEPLLAPMLSLAAARYGADEKKRVPGATHLPGYFVRVIFTRLKPGAEISPHTDFGYTMLRSHRTHIPVLTNDQCFFKVGDTEMNMKAGDMWEINNRLLHGVRNESAESRVHLIMDYVLPGERINDPEKGLIYA